MGRFGFSYMGALFLLALLASNLLWARHRPEGYDPSVEKRLLPILERVGQAWGTCGALIWRGFDWRTWTA